MQLPAAVLRRDCFSHCGKEHICSTLPLFLGTVIDTCPSVSPTPHHHCAIQTEQLKPEPGTMAVYEQSGLATTSTAIITLGRVSRCQHSTCRTHITVSDQQGQQTACTSTQTVRDSTASLSIQQPSQTAAALVPCCTPSHQLHGLHICSWHPQPTDQATANRAHTVCFNHAAVGLTQLQ